MAEKRPNHPEPVPAASQIAVLPFLAAIDGILRPAAGKSRLRITMHRVMSREGEGYLQQMCAYLGDGPYSQQPVGRMFSVDTGIMGRAFGTAKVQRTRYYPTEEQARDDLREDLIETKDDRNPNEVPISYLAIPFLGPKEKVVLTLYVECDFLNFFAHDDRVESIVRMSRGFCRLFDWLNENQPFPALRNFPLEVGEFKHSTPTVFRRLQEEIETPPPRFRSVTSFNYDAAPG
jgi:hypothetical protein